MTTNYQSDYTEGFSPRDLRGTVAAYNAEPYNVDDECMWDDLAETIAENGVTKVDLANLTPDSAEWDEYVTAAEHLGFDEDSLPETIYFAGPCKFAWI